MFSKPIAYSKQIAIYLKQGEYQKSLELSQEFVTAFPQVIESHYFLALSAIPLKDYTLGLLGAQKAFVLATGEDVLTMGLLLAQMLFLSGNLNKAKNVLLSLEATNPRNKDIEELLSLVSLAQENQADLEKHFRKLVNIDRSTAKGVVEKLKSAKKK